MVKITGLFNSFVVLGWFEIMAILVMILPFSGFIMSGVYIKLIVQTMHSMLSEITAMIGNSLKGVKLIFTSCFFVILTLNWLSLSSYVFPMTSQMFMTVGMGVMFWLISVIYGIVNKWTLTLAHLVPSNSPLYLVSFMVLVETVSQLIRPLTLSLRLSANITAGHLLMSLLTLSALISVSGFILMGLEMMVALIQAFVFTMLVTYYTSESV